MTSASPFSIRPPSTSSNTHTILNGRHDRARAPGVRWGGEEVSKPQAVGRFAVVGPVAAPLFLRQVARIHLEVLDVFPRRLASRQALDDDHIPAGVSRDDRDVGRKAVGALDLVHSAIFILI